MRTSTGAVIAFLAGLLISGCSGKPSVNERSDDSAEPSRPKVVRIVFDLPGDDIGSQEDQAILDALREALVEARAGEIVSSGFGMGTMELVVAIDSDESLEVIRRIVGEVSPGAKYRIVGDALISVQSPSDREEKRP